MDSGGKMEKSIIGVDRVGIEIALKQRKPKDDFALTKKIRKICIVVFTMLSIFDIWLLIISPSVFQGLLTGFQVGMTLVYFMYHFISNGFENMINSLTEGLHHIRRLIELEKRVQREAKKLEEEIRGINKDKKKLKSKFKKEEKKRRK